MNMDFMLRIMRFSMESEENQPEHIKRCKARYDNSYCPNQLSEIDVVPVRPEDGVLAEESRQPWYAGDCKRSDQTCSVRPGHVLPQAAHFANILSAAHTMDDAACTKKQQGFKKGVSHQVEHADRVRTRTTRNEHVSKLADCGIRKNSLYVRLDHADRSCKQCCKYSDNCHDE